MVLYVHFGLVCQAHRTFNQSPSSMLRDCMLGVAQMMERSVEKDIRVFAGRRYVPVEYLKLYASNLRILVGESLKEKE